MSSLRTLALFSVLFALLPVFFSSAGALQMDDISVGAKNGDWAAYIGSPPYEEYEWMHLSVLNVTGASVQVSIRYDLRPSFRSSEYYWPDHPRIMNIDVASGSNNLFLFIIPPDLTVGDIVPTPVDYPNITIEGIETKEYGGSQRTVIYGSYENASARYTGLGGTGTLYWDKETGVLVEIAAQIGGFTVTSLKLTGTSLWTGSLVGWFFQNSLFLLVISASCASIAVLLITLVRTRRNIMCKVTHPTLGGALVICGISVLIGGVLNFSVFNQMFSAATLAFGPILVVTGLLLSTGAWVTLSKDKLVVDVGMLLIASASMMLGVVAASAVYREIGAFVPYTVFDLRPYLTVSARIAMQPVVEGVFIYPFSWMLSPLITAAICMGVVGLLFKFFYRQ